MPRLRITDPDALSPWLTTRSREEVLLLAYRSAARVLPLVVGRMPYPYFGSLGVFRAVLVSGVAQSGATQEMRGAVMRAAVSLSEDPKIGASSTAAATSAFFSASAASRGLDAPARHMALLAVRFAADAAMFAPTANSSSMAQSAFWQSVEEDCKKIEDGTLTLRSPLWTGAPDWADRLWTETRRSMLEQPRWSFWLRWYDSVLTGASLSPDLLRQVGLIPPEIWDEGPDAVAHRIAEIEARRSPFPQDAGSLDSLLAETPAASAASVAAVRHALDVNRGELPPVFDAVLGYIALEIARLQARNYRDDDDRAECRRQIRVLTTLHEAVGRLQSLVPETGALTEDDAVRAERLLSLFSRKFMEWPRANADELVDTTYRAALVGAVAVMLPLAGVTTPYALAAGLTLFAGTKIVGAAKAAKDLLAPKD